MLGPQGIVVKFALVLFFDTVKCSDSDNINDNNDDSDVQLQIIIIMIIIILKYFL